MEYLTQNELLKVSDSLYKIANPSSNMCTPNSVYIIVMEKWYPEYQNSQTDMDFFNWCLLNKY